MAQPLSMPTTDPIQSGPPANPVGAGQKQPSAKDAKRAKENSVHEKNDSVPGELSLKQALKLFDDSRTYIDTGYRGNWDKYFKIYQGERVDQGYYGSISVSNREAHTIIETLVANIAGGLPKFNFVPTNEEQNTDTAVLNGTLDYYLQCNDMNLKNQIWVRDMLMYGTGIIHCSWKDSKLDIQNVALRDFFVDPKATDFVKTESPAEYAGFQYLTSKSALEGAEVYDAEKNAWVKKYTKLESLGQASGDESGGPGMDKAFKDMFQGSTLDKPSDDQVYVILMYHLPTGRIYEIGNRKEFIYNQPSHLQREEETRTVSFFVDGIEVESEQKLDEIKPFIPMAALRDYIDSSLFFARGELSVISGDAELLNDYESMDADNNAYQNTPMYQIDPQYADMAAEIETIPGAVYPIPKGALTPIERPQLTQDITLKKQEIQSRMRRGTAADEAVQGVAQSKGRTTAFEVQEQLNQANARFSTKITNLSSGGYAQLGSIAFKFIQIFLTPDVAVRIVGPMGVEFKNFDRWEFSGEYEPHVELETEIKRKKAEAAQVDAEMFKQFVGDANFNQVEVKRYFLKKTDPALTDEVFNGLLAKPAPPPPPAQDPIDLVAMYNGKFTPEDIRSQIEQIAGLQPSPMHKVKEEHELINTAADQVNRLDQASDSTGAPIQFPTAQPVAA